MGKIFSAISDDGSVFCHAIDSTDIVLRARTLHRTSPVVTAALGRLLTGASLMGCMLKGEDDNLTLRVNGGGPIGALIAVSDSGGNVRGYAANAVVDLPPNRYGKPDVAAAVGHDGSLFVMRDLGLKEPYISQTPLITGEIAEDITEYYAASEQTPTVCALGVLMSGLQVERAGGFLIQLLPGCDTKTIDLIEQTVSRLEPITVMLKNGMTAEEIALKTLDGLTPNIISSYDAEYRCNCSREKTDGLLMSIGSDELIKLADEQPVTAVDCHFCNRKYRYSPDELRSLAKK